MSSVLIENVGAIDRLTIPVPDGGGVVVLRGPNGIGKTTALDGVMTCVTGVSGSGKSTLINRTLLPLAAIS